MALLGLAPIILCAGLLPFCIIKQFDVRMVYYIAIILCCAVNLFVGFYNVLSYRLPYMIIDMSDYAKLENLNGIISSIASIAISALITFLSTLLPFNYVMGAGFVISSIFCVIASITIAEMKVKSGLAENDKKEKFNFSKLKKREFIYFYIPNFARGCSMGIMNVIAVICIKDISKNPSVISALVTILSVSLIAGCLIYRSIGRKVKTSTLYMICSVEMFLFLPLMLIGKSVAAFCVFYFLAGMGFNIINIAGAVFATEIIDYKDIGTYTSVRLITMVAGQAAASFFVSRVIDFLPSVIILATCGVFQLISGVMYYIYQKQIIKRS